MSLKNYYAQFAFVAPTLYHRRHLYKKNIGLPTMAAVDGSYFSLE